MIKAIFFDLDGTLLPMDQDVFVRAYLGELCKKLAPMGYDPKKVAVATMTATGAMQTNDGSKTNMEAFWDCFCGILGEELRGQIPMFDDFYRNEFHRVKDVCGFNAKAKETVDRVKMAGYRVGLATNPLFPRLATIGRIGWAGLDPEDFEFITTYENSVHCKPNPDYYKDLLELIDVPAEQILMVGNDVKEDMVAETVGMDVFLLTDCMINSENKDISGYKQGDLDALLAYLGA